MAVLTRSASAGRGQAGLKSQPARTAVDRLRTQFAGRAAESSRVWPLDRIHWCVRNPPAGYTGNAAMGMWVCRRLHVAALNGVI